MIHKVDVRVGDAVPHGNLEYTPKVLSLWRSIACLDLSFQAEVEPGRNVKVEYDLTALLRALEKINQNHDSFDSYRLSQIETGSESLSSILTIIISSSQSENVERQSELTLLALQHLYLACNLTLPGSFQCIQPSLSSPSFVGVSLVDLDASLFHGAEGAEKGYKSETNFDQIWSWLLTTNLVSGTPALSPVQKVLTCILQIAQLNSSQSVLKAFLGVQLLPTLLGLPLNCDLAELRQRLVLVVEGIPETLDCLPALCELRSMVLSGHTPLVRPNVVKNTVQVEVHSQLSNHNSTLELALFWSVILLRNLVSKQKPAYVFETRLV